MFEKWRTRVTPNVVKPEHLDPLDGLFRISDLLIGRYHQQGGKPELDSAIEILHELLDISPEDHFVRPLAASDLCTAFRLLYLETNATADLDESVRFGELSLSICPPGHVQRAYCMNPLANALCLRFNECGALDDLDAAVKLQREGLELRPPGHKDRSSSVNNLAVILRTRFTRLGLVNDLEEAIRLYREAVQLYRPDNMYLPNSLHNLAEALSLRFERLKTDSDVDEAVRLHTEALRLRPSQHPQYSDSLAAAGDIHHIRYVNSGGLADLQLAIEFYRKALTLRPVSHPNRIWTLRSLALCLVNRHESLGSVDDNLEAVQLFREVLKLPAFGLVQLADSINNLASNLFVQYLHSHRLEVLEEAISLHRQALKIRTPGKPGRSMSLNDLANALYGRFAVKGDISDLEDAIASYREVLDINSEYREAIGNLGNVLLARFERTGNIDDLEEAVQLQRKAVACDAKPPDLHNLANGLFVRFQQSGLTGDLDEAIHLHRQFLGDTPETHVDRPQGLCDIGNCLSARFALSESLSDLEEAVLFHREALKLAPETHANRSHFLHNLANVLRIRYRRLGPSAKDDIDEAIDLHSQALKQHSPGHPSRYLSLCNLASSYQTRLRGTDVANALRLLTEALGFLPTGHSYRSHCLSRISLLRLQPHTDTFDIHISLKLLSEALSDNHYNAQLRLSDSAEVLELIDEQDVTADDLRTQLLKAEVDTIRLLPQVAYFGLDIRTRLQSLRKGEILAMQAASHALALSRPQEAVELVEEGRGVFWTQALRLRTTFDELPAEERQTLLDLSHRLEQGSFTSSGATNAIGSKNDVEVHAARQRHLSDEFNTMIDAIRSRPGLEQFMAHSTYEQLGKVADRGPVVMLLASRTSCDALIIKASGVLERIPLRDTSLSRLKEISAHLKEANQYQRDIPVDERGIKKVVLGQKAIEKPGARDVLKEIWTAVVKPVLHALSLKVRTSPYPPCARLKPLRQSQPAHPDRPRLWWCPTGPFVFLPLHAAGEKAAGWCTDYVVSSYTPTLTALSNARSTSIPTSKSDAKILLAAVPYPCTGSPLPSTVEEIKAIQGSIPVKALISLPKEDDALLGQDCGASVQTMLDILPTASIIHLACHGQQNLRNPLDSGFIMRDGILTISQLMPVPLPRAFLAFLSACETAKGDREQPDQAIHLAAAMLFAGFKSVVGTMW